MRSLKALIGSIATCGGSTPNRRQESTRTTGSGFFGRWRSFGLTGVPLSALQKDHGFKEQLFPAIKVFVNREREELYERIDRRVDSMLESGLKGEVERLLAMGYAVELKSMQSLGYRQMAAHLAGAISIEEAAYRIKRETRHYAKRQITWFRGDQEFRSFDADDVEGISRYVIHEISGSGN